MSDTRAVTRCIQCQREGEGDDHPKVHYGADTYHHDCLPIDVQDAVTGSIGGERTQAIIDAAKSGTRGDALLAHIEGMHVPEDGYAPANPIVTDTTPEG